MYGLKRLLEIEEERKKRREEKARLKKEKEKEKKRLKSIERRKKQNRKSNKKQYQKRRKEELERRKAEGEEQAYFSIYITKNRKKIRFVANSWWKKEAYRLFNEAIERNKEKAVFPQTVYTNRKNGAHEASDVKYEILLVKKVKEGENTVSSFRNDEGKFVDNITNWKDHIIVDKHDWLVEEQFGVYGYHPVKDKKTYTFILNNVLLSNEDIGEEMRSVIVYKNRVIFQYLEDFDIITCYDNEQAKKMYDMLQNDVTKLKKKYVVFMGETKDEKWIDKIEEKTGWNRLSISHKTTAR